MRTFAAVFLIAVAALGADTRELQQRRQLAAAAFKGGILLLRAKSLLDGSADGFRQDPAFYYFTGLENTVGAILAIDGRSGQSWLFLPTHPPLGSLEGTSGSDAVKQAGIEHVADWSGLAGFLEENRNAPTPLYYAAMGRSVPDLPLNITSDPANAPLWAIAIAKKWPSFQLQDVRTRVIALMDVQRPPEVINVRAAAKATVQAVMVGIRAIRPGVSQRTVEAAVEDACWKQGAHGASFCLGLWREATAFFRNPLLPKPGMTISMPP